MFRAADKAPFTKSGESVLGALEYDPATDQVKCHECGEWLAGLFQHVSFAHGESPRDYRERHGLAKSTALCGLRYSQKCSRRVKRTGIKNRLSMGPKAMGKLSAAAQERGDYVNGGVTQETLNLRRSCAAQLVQRLKDLAEDLGRTPSYREMMEAGIYPKSLKVLHGSVEEALAKAGLKSRKTHFIAAA